MMVTFSSNLSPRLFRASSGMRPLAAAQARAEETIVLTIPSIPLLPGDYWIDLQVKANDKTLDYVRHAGEFTVLPSDVFGSGYHFTANDGHFSIPWDWEIRPTVDVVAAQHRAADDELTAGSGPCRRPGGLRIMRESEAGVPWGDKSWPRP